MNALDLALEQLVVDDSNQAVVRAAMLMAQRTPPFGALLIDASTGAGKTSLLRIVEEQFRANYPDDQVRRVAGTDMAFYAPDADPFGDDLVGASLLLIDDVDLVLGRGHDEQLTMALNYMSREGRRVVMTSTAPVNDLLSTSVMDWRLMSRLTAATTLNLRSPALYTRMAMIQRKMKAWPLLRLDLACIEALAYRFGGNGHHLAGAVNRLAVVAAGETVIDVDFIDRELQDLMRMAPRVSVQRIQETVARAFHIPVKEMTSARRAREVARPRQAAMYLSKQLTPKSLPDIGRRFGNRDHTTVIHAVRQVERFRREDPEFDGLVSAIERQLAN